MAIVDRDWIAWRDKQAALKVMFEKTPQISDIARLAFLNGKVAGMAAAKNAIAVAKEYNELILHMNAGGDFFEFQEARATKDKDSK